MIAGAKRRLYVLTLAINPNSGRGHARRQARLATNYFTMHAISVKEVEGRDIEDFRARFKKVLESDEVTGVIAFGGDGFIHEIVQHIVPRGVPLGVVPCGTGNDFARSLGLFTLSLSQQIQLIHQGDTSEIDLGRVGDTYFAAILSTGFDTLVNDRANQMKWPRGRMKYNIAMIEKLIALRPHHYQLRLDDVYIDVKATLVTIANGPSYGGGMQVCPQASLSDGLFDVMVLGEVSRTELLKVFPKVYRGRHVGHPAVSFYRCRKIEINGSGSSFADGEPVSPLPITAECLSGVLRVWAA